MVYPMSHVGLFSLVTKGDTRSVYLQLSLFIDVNCRVVLHHIAAVCDADLNQQTTNMW